MKEYFTYLMLILGISCSQDTSDLIVKIPGSDLSTDRYEASISDFEQFIEDTKFITTADSMKWSGVFNIVENKWEPLPNANWQKPNGVDVREGNFPVSQISYYDACAFCEWKNGRLPTADEWDKIAGDEVIPGNVWQGVFPVHDRGEDGFEKRVAPIGSFTPNSLGVHQSFGNVWEWTSTIDSNGQMIIKGGSFLCDQSFCSGYYPGKISNHAKGQWFGPLGF